MLLRLIRYSVLPGLPSTQLKFLLAVSFLKVSLILFTQEEVLSHSPIPMHCTSRYSFILHGNRSIQCPLDSCAARVIRSLPPTLECRLSLLEKKTCMETHASGLICVMWLMTGFTSAVMLKWILKD